VRIGCIFVISGCWSLSSKIDILFHYVFGNAFVSGGVSSSHEVVDIYSEYAAGFGRLRRRTIPSLHLKKWLPERLHHIYLSVKLYHDLLLAQTFAICGIRM
jgi:hypothetical protein